MASKKSKQIEELLDGWRPKKFRCDLCGARVERIRGLTKKKGGKTWTVWVCLKCYDEYLAVL